MNILIALFWIGLLIVVALAVFQLVITVGMLAITAIAMGLKALWNWLT